MICVVGEGGQLSPRELGTAIGISAAAAGFFGEIFGLDGYLLVAVLTQLAPAALSWNSPSRRWIPPREGSSVCSVSHAALVG